MIKKFVQRSYGFHLVTLGIGILLLILLISVILRQSYFLGTSGYQQGAYQEAVGHFIDQERWCGGVWCGRTLYNKATAMVSAGGQILLDEQEPYSQEDIDQVKAYRYEAIEIYDDILEKETNKQYFEMIATNKEIVQELLGMLDEQQTIQDEMGNEEGSEAGNEGNEAGLSQNSVDSNSNDYIQEQSIQEGEDTQSTQFQSGESFGESNGRDIGEDNWQESISQQGLSQGSLQGSAQEPLSDEIIQQLNQYQQRLQQDQYYYQDSFHPLGNLQESGLSQTLPDQSGKKDW